MHLPKFLLLAGCLASTLLAQSSQPPPRISSLRHVEDYSYLADEGAGSGHWWEALKAIPLDEDRNWLLSFGAELRLTYETYENDRWGGIPDADHGYFWTRALPYVELRAHDRFRAFAQLITAFEFEDEASRRSLDENALDLLQGFVEWRQPVGEGAITLQAGRKLLSYGSSRLIGIRYGPNVPQTFDVLLARYEGDHEGAGLTVDGFYARAVDPGPHTFDDATSDDLQLWSIYATVKGDLFDDLDLQAGFDAYYIGYSEDGARFDQGTANEERHTFGARFFGKLEGWDFNFEGFLQTGSFGEGDIFAWSVASDTGYTFRETAMKPRIGLRANIISGDDDPNDPDLGTFNPLFPRGPYFGEVARIGPYNLINLHPTVRLALTDDLQFETGPVFYWRESTDDGIYNSGGILLRGAGGSDERYVGTQFDATFTWRPDRHTTVLASYAFFTAGAFLSDTGADETIHFFTLEVLFRF